MDPKSLRGSRGGGKGQGMKVLGVALEEMIHLGSVAVKHFCLNT